MGMWGGVGQTSRWCLYPGIFPSTRGLVRFLTRAIKPPILGKPILRYAEITALGWPWECCPKWAVFRSPSNERLMIWLRDYGSIEIASNDAGVTTRLKPKIGSSVDSGEPFIFFLSSADFWRLLKCGPVFLKGRDCAETATLLACYPALSHYRILVKMHRYQHLLIRRHDTIPRVLHTNFFVGLLDSCNRVFFRRSNVWMYLAWYAPDGRRGCVLVSSVCRFRSRIPRLAVHARSP